jgi:hypothetical protein
LLFAISVIALLAIGSVIGWVPMGVGVVGHEGSTIIVVANSLQILAFRRPPPLGARAGAEPALEQARRSARADQSPAA